MSVYRGPKIVTDGLVLCLDAADKNSYSGTGTTWYDLGKNNYNGTLVNGPTFSSNNMGAIVFDGTDDRGSFTTPVNSTDNQTYEVWTNAVSGALASSGYAYILHNNSLNSSIGNSFLTIGLKPTNIYFGAFNGALSTMTTNITATNSIVRQLVLKWDGSNQYLYADGQLQDSEALSAPIQNFNTITSFGDYYNSTFRMILGNIYTIRIYNRSLSSSEILQNYNATKGRFGK